MVTSSASANLTQITNLTNAWQLDPANLTQEFGLQIYGSGTTTGIVVDSGGDQVTEAACIACIRCKHTLPISLALIFTMSTLLDLKLDHHVNFQQ